MSTSHNIFTFHLISFFSYIYIDIANLLFWFNLSNTDSADNFGGKYSGN